MPLDLSFRSTVHPAERSSDVLGEIFSIPNIQKKDKPKPKMKPHPPSVATSEAYDQYLENIENIKITALKEKERKKIERQTKRKHQAEEKVKRRSKKNIKTH